MPDTYIIHTVDRFTFALKLILQLISLIRIKLAEGVGFEPTVALRLLLISSQMPLTTQPPFQPFIYKHLTDL